MSKSTPHSLLEWLESRDAETVLHALRPIDASSEIASFLPKLIELPHAGETDLRFTAAHMLSEAAMPALETRGWRIRNF